VTVPDSYQLPNMMDFSSQVAGCRVFSKIDLRKGYFQIPMHPADVEKMAITTPFSLFEFTRMPFGLRNAGCTFQRLMDRILAGLAACFWFLDNFIVASADTAAHTEHLCRLFDRLQENDLVINAEKCVFGVKTVDFLGHHVSEKGIQPLSSHTTAILCHPLPATVKQLQALLGLVNFYRRFIPAAAKLLRPLTDYLKGGKAGNEQVVWSPERLAAVEAAKQAVAQATHLVHPLPGAEISLFVDASADHVGAALQQRAAASDPWRPLGFFSKKLEPEQTCYSAFDRELWACFAGIQHFRHMLEGRRFTIYTDHKPLTHALHRTSDPWTARQCRQLAYIAEFTGDIQHVVGRDNVVADTLSRPPPTCKAEEPDLALVAMVAAADSSLDYAAIALK
jgi:RNase H-like domain found in reverse transcriptase/Reverse transcriptase (RNA-dependent DNA polymerase)